MNPIISLHRRLIDEEDYEFAIQRAKGLNIELSNDDMKQTKKAILKTIMSRWLNAGDALFEMMVQHLPSPTQAMRYRTELLYQGPIDDPVAQSMKKSDPEGPLLMYVSKMVPNNDFSKFYAFGRVFSGTLKEG